MTRTGEHITGAKKLRVSAVCRGGYSLVVSHYCPMSEKTDAQRRSEARQAAVLVRMSFQEREALFAAAAERGVTLTGLLREAVAPYLDKELQEA
jgi:hypothetical protein